MSRLAGTGIGQRRFVMVVGCHGIGRYGRGIGWSALGNRCAWQRCEVGEDEEMPSAAGPVPSRWYRDTFDAGTADGTLKFAGVAHPVGGLPPS
jgi:hypothetical protein